MATENSNTSGEGRKTTYGGGTLNDKLGQLHAERRQRYTPEEEPRNGTGNPEDENRKPGNRKILLGIGAIVAVIALGAGAWWLLSDMGEEQSEDKPQVTTDDREVVELQMKLAESEFENLDREFEQLESQRQIIVDDTLKVQLTQKYESAKLEVEKLRRELKESANKSAKEIEKLNDQIRVLRDLIKHYLEEIDRLNKENAELRNQNQELSQRLEQTSSNLAQTQREREHLSERMVLAEKLNVTGVQMTMLNKKDKDEKKIKNARKFKITFTIPQNNSTPVGTKTIYAVIRTPEGQILDGAGTFPFEGGNVPASARRQVEYGGEEIGGVTMYYDIRNALSPGQYTVQLFSDGYALGDPRYFDYK